MYRCIGCGVKLQNEDINILGYTKNIENNLCERCFRIRNYNEYKTVIKDNNDFIKILKQIDKTNDLVVLVVDLFNINKNLEQIKEYINNDILLVLTKRDILPKSCYDKKLMEYFDIYKLNIIDKVIVSSFKNYNFDILYNKINQYKKSKNVYVVGFTNSGKSTLINKILYNYSKNETVITTSNLPSTTIDSIIVDVNDNLTLIDTPGLLDNSDIINYVDNKTLKKIIPLKEIKPKIYQIKSKQTLLIEDLLRIDLNEKNNLTLYISNSLNIRRVYKENNELKDLKKHTVCAKKDDDIVIQGLGFIKISNDSNIVLYTKEGVSVFVRKKLI